MAKSAISWVTHTQNDQTGCTKVGPECARCYAERDTWRFAHAPTAPYRYKAGVIEGGHWTGSIYTDIDQRRQIFRSLRDARASRRTWLGSMTDLWHESLPLEDRALALLAEEVRTLPACRVPQTLLFLSKRPARLRDWQRLYFPEGLPPQVEVGTTAGTQAMLQERLPPLLEVRATTRFLSCEPLLTPLNLSRVEIPRGSLHLLIVGGESGAKARGLPPGWVRSLRDQTGERQILFHFKQWGSLPLEGQETTPDGVPLLDGEIYQDLPGLSEGPGYSEMGMK